jgi:hypothetical protein
MSAFGASSTRLRGGKVFGLYMDGSGYFAWIGDVDVCTFTAVEADLECSHI